ncbi:MAG: hypothetical protein IGR93_04150 [Hydrococcus sp. C42_A2020_068]|uniref:hypothetical protein n=1 Tax=Pleurocapsa sp. PCC 7327 TaxID=118163 RepID=UPI00029F9CC1|nr:hypothetical protein [Pleurocapsa sp. PCC 7327]AFY77186.1 hypothetical protein Ple7327_1839 [Pleurocapsa sp. PCC 7327]MBF2019317.1 hypothetical protein [Hydrococcus sp. C42_A2020_068]
MLIHTTPRLSFPRPLVYATYRDKLIELVPYLPNVRFLKIKSRSEAEGQVYSVNEWHAGGQIPPLLRAWLGEELLSWTEYDIWNESDFTVEWRIETHAFTEAVRCSGKNLFLEENGTTLIESRGELKIDQEKLKAVPKIFRGQVTRAVEKFLASKIEPNLLQMAEGVSHYLAQQSLG